MTSGANVPQKAKYGFDAGYLLPAAGIVCTAAVIIAAMTRSVGQFVGSCTALSIIGLGLHTSRRGKFLVWEELLDGLHLRGDERVLDLGCGRGAVLLLAAQRLTTGWAVGVDLWHTADQSGNSADA